MPDSELIRFEQLRGHDTAIDFLRNAFTSNRLAHSLLFAGPDGIGKRSLGLAFVSWVLCTNRGGDSCGECGACKQVAALSHPDVRVVSIPAGKKEIGVDHARDLKRWISLRSAQSNMKVGLILDAEMLTVAAQNALLKTLEEPPSGSMLILATNNADALLPTVRSRCQRVPIRPLPTDIVEQVLTQRHGIAADTAATLARFAEGSPGRALSLQEVLEDTATAEVLSELATHPSGRYVRLSQMAAVLNTPESSATAKLEFLIRQYRDAALAAESPASLSTTLSDASAVGKALSALRRTNPNRQLLFEALLLRITAGSDAKS